MSGVTGEYILARILKFFINIVPTSEIYRARLKGDIFSSFTNLAAHGLQKRSLDLCRQLL